MDYKDFAENILTDLMNNKSISDILLKLKIFASKRGDKELLAWTANELNGYRDGDVPPKYRILNAGLKVRVFIGFGNERVIEFPAEMVDNEKVRERLQHLSFHQSIGELNALCNEAKEDGQIMMHVPVYAYSFISKYINGDIQDAYQYTTKAAVSQIVVAVKSILIDFLLEVSNEEDIDFNKFTKNNHNMGPITINNNGIMNNGSGNINAQGAIVGDKNIVGADNKAELLRILGEIDKIAAEEQGNADYEEDVKDIRNELSKENPDKSYLKKCFQLIPTFLTGVGSSLLANKLPELIKSALALL